MSLGLAATSLLLLLGVLELGVRLVVPDSRWRFEDGTGDWRLDDEIGWVHKPNIDVTSETPRGRVRFRTNADGLIPSGAARDKATVSTRIMLFGDSMLVGRWLPQDQNSVRFAERSWAGDRRGRDERQRPGLLDGRALLLPQRWVPAYRPVASSP